MIRDMKHPNSVRMNSISKEKCMKLVESDNFTSVSEVIEYAMRRFYEHILLDHITSLPYTRRNGKRVSMSMRINTVLEQNILDTGLLDRSDIVDYALDYFFELNERMEQTRDENKRNDAGVAAPVVDSVRDAR